MKFKADRVGILLLFLAVLYLLFLEVLLFFINFNNVKNFCDEIKYNPNISLNEIKQQVSINSLSFIEDKEKQTLMVYDKKTVGKTTCLIATNNNGKISANYMGE